VKSTNLVLPTIKQKLTVHLGSYLNPKQGNKISGFAKLAF